MRQTFTILTAATIIFCSGCSDHEADKVKAQDHIWKEQKQALDKANEVNQLIQDSAATRRQKIDELSE